MWKLGLGDTWVALAFWANIIAVLTCVVYGILCWNSNTGAKGEMIISDLQGTPYQP